MLMLDDVPSPNGGVRDRGLAGSSTLNAAGDLPSPWTEESAVESGDSTADPMLAI
jgi:hypothetical protein